jgi:tetratricopeptide (TPR) repeat protein
MGGEFKDVHRRMKGNIATGRRAAMTMQEGLAALGLGTAARQMHNRAYFLDLLGDSHTGLGRHEAAIEAYRQAAQEFEAQGAPCSYALCLLKIADSYLSLDEPWHAIGYLEVCLPLLRELGLVRHESLAQDQLAACQIELARAPLLGSDGRPAPRPSAAGPSGQVSTRRRRAGGKFDVCPVQTDRPSGCPMTNSRPGEPRSS